MKSIQMTALILWGAIFMIAAFILGQFLVSKDIFDITGLFTINGEDEGNESLGSENNLDDELASDIVINKIGQETIRIGLNVGKDYFSEYYKDYINYIMVDEKLYKQDQKVTITDELASDYVFYAVARGVDIDKYTSEESEDKISITEGNLNSFVDKMFAKSVAKEYKDDSSNGYDKVTKTYRIEKNDNLEESIQELTSIENITSNQIKLIFDCKTESNQKNQINMYVVYRGGRYILTDVEKLEK